MPSYQPPWPGASVDRRSPGAPWIPAWDAGIPPRAWRPLPLRITLPLALACRCAAVTFAPLAVPGEGAVAGPVAGPLAGPVVGLVG